MLNNTSREILLLGSYCGVEVTRTKLPDMMLLPGAVRLRSSLGRCSGICSRWSESRNSFCPLWIDAMWKMKICVVGHLNCSKLNVADSSSPCQWCTYLLTGWGGSRRGCNKCLIGAGVENIHKKVIDTDAWRGYLEQRLDRVREIK